MKKVLLTTTALTMLAGAAAADISFSGSARFGLSYTGAVAAATNAATLANTAATLASAATLAANAAASAAASLAAATALTYATAAVNAAAAAAASTAAASASTAAAAASAAAAGSAAATATGTRMRFNINASGETDGGLTFGASTRINIGTASTGTIRGANIWISNGAATLTVGNTDGAIASSVALYGGSLGFTGNGGLRPATHAGYVEGSGGGAGPANVKVAFSLGGIKVAASTVTGSGVTEVGASYSAGAFSIAAGTSSVGSSVSATYSAGDLTVGVLSTGANYRVWGTFGMGSTTLKLTHTSVVAGTTTGVGVTHSLGGGASIGASFGTTPAGNAGEIGMNFSF